ncbi:MAG TPA: hypothetical protein VFK22_05205 [Candidatus Dormibacteraeota bacterium]|nr:hypothetical protein [Candidatus Dormibacteraeota bacterium]
MDRRVTRDRSQTFEYLMRAWLIAAVLVAATGCGAYQFPGAGSSPSPAAGTVSGRVLAVPCAPVEQLSSPCAGRPVPKLELDYVAGGSVVGSAITDSSGYYSVTVKPGSYQVKLKTYMRVLSGPLTVSVASGANVVANYVLDSGIRMPVPQQ